MKTSTLNPYRQAFSKVRRRLLWDLKKQSRVSRKHLRSVLGKYENQKAVIVCNGPSLLKTDFSLLNGIFCFGLNKINLLFDKTDWRPSAIVSVNRHVIEQNRDFFCETDIPLYLSRFAVSEIAARPKVCFLDTTAGTGVFARDCSMTMAEGFTVTYAAMQLAFHMGFSKVALIGCDHNFATRGPANKAVKAEETDPNHFDPKYFADGVTWQLPDLVQSELHYQIALEKYLESERHIFNCTEGGKLEIYPRMTLEQFSQL